MRFFRSAKDKKDKEVQTVDLYFSRNNELPPVPFELKQYLSQGEWESRLLHIAAIINRSRKPVLERVYVAFAFTATVASPIILFSLLNNISESHTMSRSAFAKLRFVGVGVIIAIGLVLWLPFITWRVLGIRRLNKVLATWEDVDRARHQTFDIPRLYVRPPSIFRTMTLVRIITPNRTISSQGSSNMSAIPNLYYKNPPVSASRAYYYPYAKRDKEVPRTSVGGGGVDYRTSTFKEPVVEYGTKSPVALTRPATVYAKTPPGYARADSYSWRPQSTIRRAPGSEPPSARRRSTEIPSARRRSEVPLETKQEYRTSTFYKEYFDEVNRKEALRTPIKGTMAGGRAATPLEMAVMPSDSDVPDDKW